MTYEIAETSLQDAAPVELVSFVYGATTFRYTSSEANYTQDANTFTSTQITVPEVEATTEQARNGLDISVPRDNPVALLFQAGLPALRISVTVRRVHRTDMVAEAIVYWLGFVSGVEWTGATATLRCEPLDISLSRPGLVRSYGRQCGLILYRAGLGQCNVDRALHEVAATVVTNTGVILTVDAVDPRSYGGGFVEWTDAGGILRRVSIRSNSGAVLALTQRAASLEADDAVTVVPGCDHTLATCRDVFENEPNYGGQPLIPLKNPFDGTPLY